MFYNPKAKDHGLRHDPLKSLVIPRPIGWISTISPKGIPNLAPYSHFNIVSINPPAVMFSAGSLNRDDPRKDSQRNAEDTGDFVVNVVTYDLRNEMNLSSAEVDSNANEAAIAGLELIPSRVVRAPRVAASPIHLECKHLMTVVLPCVAPGEERNSIVIGEIVGIHISDAVLTDGRIDVEKLRPVARLGYMDYAVIDKIFTMPRPIID